MGRNVREQFRYDQRARSSGGRDRTRFAQRRRDARARQRPRSSPGACRSQKRAAAEPLARAATASIENPFSALDREGFRALASRLDINAAFLSKLRDRNIDPVTIPGEYCRHVAEEMDEDIEIMAAHLYAPRGK